MEKGAKRGRKRPADITDQSDIPVPKRKKKTSQLSKHLDSGVINGETEQPTVISDSRKSKATSVNGKATKLKRILIRKPNAGSWMSNVGSILAYRCVEHAIKNSFDPRDQIEEFKWDDVADGYLTPYDLKMVWIFIQMEFTGKTLMEIAEELKPYSKLTSDPFIKLGVKMKYKDEMPKPPVSPYLLFCKSSGPKLKAKHPDLSRTEMAVKLGKKWKSLSASKQEKYKQQYEALKQEYSAKLEQFYVEHPDAKPVSRKNRQRKEKHKPQISAEEQRLKELMAELPKPPPTSYFMFCKSKREKVTRKYPTLTSQEVTRKLSKKWKSLGTEGQAKYKTEYQSRSKQYKRELEKFYARHPDAKELIQKSRRLKQTLKTSSTAEKKVHGTSSSPATQTLLQDQQLSSSSSSERESEKESERESENESDSDDQQQPEVHDPPHSSGVSSESSDEEEDSED